jgi:hypothetical protein
MQNEQDRHKKNPRARKDPRVWFSRGAGSARERYLVPGRTGSVGSLGVTGTVKPRGAHA